MAARSSSLTHTYPGSPVQQSPHRVQVKRRPSLNHGAGVEVPVRGSAGWSLMAHGLLREFTRHPAGREAEVIVSVRRAKANASRPAREGPAARSCGPGGGGAQVCDELRASNT